MITRYYDSLLTKVTAKAPTPEMAIARMDRALREFRVRGVSTNIAFVENLLKHPTFLNNEYTTRFIDETPELFQFKKRRDRATKVLTYIADITVNGHPETKGHARPPAYVRDPKPPFTRAEPRMGTRNLLEQKGPQALADWMGQQRQLLITDTTMRATFQHGMLGRRDIRCGLSVLAGMPVATPARPARTPAQCDDPNAAARLKRCGLYQLP